MEEGREGKEETENEEDTRGREGRKMNLRKKKEVRTLVSFSFTVNTIIKKKNKEKHARNDK